MFYSQENPEQTGTSHLCMFSKNLEPAACKLSLATSGDSWEAAAPNKDCCSYTRSCVNELEGCFTIIQSDRHGKQYQSPHLTLWKRENLRSKMLNTFRTIYIYLRTVTLSSHLAALTSDDSIMHSRRLITTDLAWDNFNLGWTNTDVKVVTFSQSLRKHNSSHASEQF